MKQKQTLLGQIASIGERIAYFSEKQKGSGTVTIDRDEAMNWENLLKDRLRMIEDNCLPHGSGFDAGTTILKASGEGITLFTSFHHMNEVGYYDGWTEHKIHIVPNLTHGFIIRSISGPNKNDIKDYISDVFNSALRGPAYVFEGE